MFQSIAAAVRASAGRSISIKNSKMPGSSFATDPFACRAGSKLADVAGSTCSRCYARRLAKMRPSVAQGYATNETALQSAAVGDIREDFVAGMAHQIQAAAIKTRQPFHRWFDAGDLASLAVLELIADIARATPSVRHWLPTREISIVRAFVRKHGPLEDSLPANLVLRVSSTMVDDAPRRAFPWTSTVYKQASAHGRACPAQSQGNQCRECRACWSRDVSNVSYHAH